MSQVCTAFVIDGSHSLITSQNYNLIVEYLDYILLEKCKKMRKTDWVSILISNTYEMLNEEDIEDIVQLCSCAAPINGELFKSLINRVKEFNDLKKVRVDDENGQMLAKTILVSNIQMNQKFGARKVKRQIMIFTDNVKDFSLETEVLQVMKEQLQDTRLILVTCMETGLTEDQSTWSDILEEQKMNGLDPIQIGIHDLIREIKKFPIPLVNPIRTFSGELRFGSDIELIASLNPMVSEDAFKDNLSMCMAVEGYPATKSVSGLNRKLVIKEKTKNENESNKDEYIPVKSIIEYQIRRPKSESDTKGGKIKKETDEMKKEDGEVEYNSIIVGNKNITKAYRYGLDYVVVPPTLLNEMEYQTSPGLDIRGFASRSLLPREYLTSESTMIIPDTRTGNKADARSFSTLVDVMLKHDKIAVARYVAKPNSEVNMVCLCPLLASNADLINLDSDNVGDMDGADEGQNSHIRMMILNVLPFSEDEKHMTLPSLLNPRTSSGKIKKEDTEDEIDDELMQKFINSMDTDNISEVDKTSIYKHHSAFRNNSFPGGNGYNGSRNPMEKVNVTLQYKDLALASWIDQKYLPPVEAISASSSKTFTAPPLPRELEREITPYTNKENPLSDKDKADIIREWTTKPGELLTSANAREGGEAKSWLATELGPSQFELI